MKNIIALSAAALALAGCVRSEKSEAAYEVSGVLNGQPVRLVVAGESQAVTRTAPDPEVIAQAAKVAATAAIEAAKASIPGAEAIARSVAGMLPAPEKGGLDGATGGALGAAGGLGLLALREYLNARQHKRDADEGWTKADAYARALPPDSKIPGT